MQTNKTEPAWNWLVPTAALILGLAVVISTVFLSSTFLKAKSLNSTLSVTGAAFEPITSDYALWDGILSVRDTSIQTAYAALEKAMPAVRKFILDHGFTEGEIAVSPVQVKQLMNRERKIEGFRLEQVYRLESDVIEKITLLAGDASSLLEKGIQFQSHAPRYLFTRLDDMKLKMIRAATENARARAIILADATGRKVGALTSANVGVFQIRPLHSQEVSGYGLSDDRSVEKEIVSTVHTKFLME